MKFFVIGDIVGNSGVKKVEEALPSFIKENKIDFVIANAENSAEGMGITKQIFDKLVESGVNAITMGNHTWGKRDIFAIASDERILRPLNYSAGLPGQGYRTYNYNNKKIVVINLIGRVDMPVLSENPFNTVEKILNKIRNESNIVIVDFHAEATAEKIAMGYYLDGKVTAVYGTHTHVQTADEQILEKGTAYITDIGMTGPKKSVIGMDIAASLKRFVTTLPERYMVSKDTETVLDGIILEVNDSTNKAEKIERVII